MIVTTGKTDFKKVESFDDLEPMDVKAFVAEVGAWADKNFGESLIHQPLLGIIEEVGELYFVYCQDSRNGKPNYPAMEDAVGDAIVFLAHYCYRNNFDLKFCLGIAVSRLGLDVEKMIDSGKEDVVEKMRSFIGLQEIYLMSSQKFPQNYLAPTEHAFGFCLTYAALSNMSHTHLKMEQGIRGDVSEHREKQLENIAEFLTSFCALLMTFGVHFEKSIVETWNVVKERDWTKNKVDGKI